MHTWIDYQNDNWEGVSSVPVELMRGTNEYMFSDGAYNVFDYYYRDDDEDNALMGEWERVVLEVVCPKLAEKEDGDSVSLRINSEMWTFTRNDSRDNFGNL